MGIFEVRWRRERKALMSSNGGGRVCAALFFYFTMDRFAPERQDARTGNHINSSSAHYVLKYFLLFSYNNIKGCMDASSWRKWKSVLCLSLF